VELAKGMNEGCTSRRMRAAWQFVKTEGYVPEPDELLRYIHDNGLFSPPWSRNEDKRRQDVVAILRKLTNYHQPSKAHVNYNGIAKQLLDGHRLTYGTKGVIHWEDLSIFLSIIEECILHKPNPDGSVPRDRIESLWASTARRKHFRRKWSDPKYPAMREFLCAHQVLQMVDDQWGPGKSMRYTIGPEHPAFGTVSRIALKPVDAALLHDGMLVAERYCDSAAEASTAHERHLPDRLRLPALSEERVGHGAGNGPLYSFDGLGEQQAAVA
jgi:hypothetical protein